MKMLLVVAVAMPFVVVNAQHGHMGNHSSGNSTTHHTCNFNHMYDNLTVAMMAAHDCDCIGKSGMNYHQMPNNMYMIGNPHGCCGPYLVYATEQEAIDAGAACGITGHHSHADDHWMVGTVHGCAEKVFFETDLTACDVDSAATAVAHNPLTWLMLMVVVLT